MISFVLVTAKELGARISDARPEAIISASCGIEVNRIIPYELLLDAAIAMSSAVPKHCVIVQRPQETSPMSREREILWDDSMNSRSADCVLVSATDPLYILYTSGTTGIP